MRLRPRTFSGEEDEDDVEGWLLHFESICEVNGTNADGQKIALLSVSTAGAATRWVRTNSRWMSEDGRTWAQVKDRFKQRFEDDDVEEKVHACLKALHQGEKETVREYLGRFRELITRSNQVQENSWYRSWVEGLLPSLRETVMCEGYTDLEEASTLAQRKERAIRHAKDQCWNGVRQGNNDSVKAQAGSVEELAQLIGDWALHARDTGLRFPASAHPAGSRERSRETKEVVPRNTAPRGRGPPMGNDARAGIGRPRGQDRAERTCFQCGKKGHMQWDCPGPVNADRRARAAPNDRWPRDYVQTRDQDVRGMQNAESGQVGARHEGAARIAQWYEARDNGGVAQNSEYEGEDWSDVTPVWSDDEVAPAARMAGGRKRAKGEGTKKRRKVEL